MSDLIPSPVLLSILQNKTNNVTDEQVDSAVNKYLTDNPAQAYDDSEIKSEIGELKDDIVDVTEHYGKNIFNPRYLLDYNTWSVEDGVYSGEVGRLTDTFSPVREYPIIFESNTQYTLSLKAHTNNEVSASGSGLIFQFFYTDGTDSILAISNSQSTDVVKALTTKVDKSIQSLVIKHQTGGNNVWYLSEIQIEKGTIRTEYEPFRITAVDRNARDMCLKNAEKCLEIEENIDSNVYGGTKTFSVPITGTKTLNFLFRKNERYTLTNKTTKMTGSFTFTDSGGGTMVVGGIAVNASLSIHPDRDFVSVNCYYNGTGDIEISNYGINNTISDDIFRVSNESFSQMNNIVTAFGIDAFKGKIYEVVDADAYNCFPFVGTVNGLIVCAYTRQRSHSDNTKGYACYKTSKNGIVWGDEIKFADTPNVRDNVCGIGNDANGNLLIFNRVGSPKNNAKFDLYKTSDGTTFELISSPIFTTPIGHISKISYIDGVGLIAIWNNYETSRSWGTIISTDNGLTWSQSVIESELSVAECPTEISFVSLENGKILAMGRREEQSTDGGNSMYQLQSSDDGVTWSKHRTNITDIGGSTPSVICEGDKIYLYYFLRGVGELKSRVSNVADIWDNPTNWQTSTVVATGTKSYEDEGEVNAVAYNGVQVVAYYSGDSSKTGIYVTIV